MAKQKIHALSDSARSFEEGIKKDLIHFLSKQYDFIENLEQELTEFNIKTKGFYSEELNNGIKQLGHLLAKGGLLSAQPEIIAAGEMISVISTLIRALTKAWEDHKKNKKIKKFILRCKCCLEIIRGVESENLKLESVYKTNVPRKHTIDVLAQSVAMSLSTRHIFSFQDHKNRLKHGRYGIGRLHRAIRRSMIIQGKKLIETDRDDHNKNSEICLHTSTLQEFLLHCALPKKNYKHFYHKKTFRLFPKKVTSNKKSISFQQLFSESAVIALHKKQIKIYAPVNSNRYRELPPIIAHDINDEFGAGRVMNNYKRMDDLKLKDIGVDENVLKQLPQSTDTISIARQCCLICNGRVYSPRINPSLKLETYTARLPALHVKNIPPGLQNYYIYDPNSNPDDYRVWESTRSNHTTSKGPGFFATAKHAIENKAMPGLALRNVSPGC